MKISQLLRVGNNKLNALQRNWGESLVKHPGTWVLFGMLLIAEHANYSKGDELNEICDIVAGDEVKICIDGDCNPPAVQYNKTINRNSPHWQTRIRSAQERISDICASHEPDNYDDRN